MTTPRGGRPPQVRPRPPSSGRPAPVKVRPRPPAPGRLAAHRRVERGPGIALPFRLLLVVAVIALGGAVLLAATGGLTRVAAVIGTSFNGIVTNLTATPQPSLPPPTTADAPILESPGEPYTNQPSIDLVGTLPAGVAGESESVIRIYLTIGDGRPGVAAEVPVGPSQRFLVPNLTLNAGSNTFTATLVGPTDLESEPSASVTYILDTTKPRIVVSSPKANAVINATTVRIVGQTQGRSLLSARNTTTNATVGGAADGKGAFSLIVPLGTGTNTIELTATDPATNVNTAKIAVRRGTGALTARVSASIYQIKRSQLPEPVRLVVLVSDPDGRPLADATVTFTLAVPGVPAIASSPLTTSSRGTATFTTTIPRGATTGQCSVTVIVQSKDDGDTTDRTVITIVR